MKDTLSTIQNISNIARIVCKVLMICCIVASCLSLVGIISEALGLDETFEVFGVTIHAIVQNEKGLSKPEAYAAMAAGMVLTALTAVQLGFACKYCANELAAGTPFTLDGAKEMFRLGILVMALELGAAVAVGIIAGVLDAIVGGNLEMEANAGDGIITGLMLLAMSFVCKHGAETSGGKEPSTEIKAEN